MKLRRRTYQHTCEAGTIFTADPTRRVQLREALARRIWPEHFWRCEFWNQNATETGMALVALTWELEAQVEDLARSLAGE